MSGGTVASLCAEQKILFKNCLTQLSTSVIISESKFANLDDMEYDLWIKALIAFILCINGIKLKKEVQSPVKVGLLYIDDFYYFLYISACLKS